MIESLNSAAAAIIQSAAAIQSAQAAAVVANMQAAMVTWRAVVRLRRTRTQRDYDSYLTRWIRKRLVRWAGCRPLVRNEAEVIESWQHYDGPKVSVPRGLRHLLGRYVGGPKWRRASRAAAVWRGEP